MHSTVHTFRTPDGVRLGVEQFGERAAPLVLLAGGPTMLSWPDALCEALARGGRHVVRYDVRDSGASASSIPRHPRTRCVILPPTPRHWPANSTTGQRTWRASASVDARSRQPRWRPINATCRRCRCRRSSPVTAAWRPSPRSLVGVKPRRAPPRPSPRLRTVAPAASPCRARAMPCADRARGRRRVHPTGRRRA